MSKYKFAKRNQVGRIDNINEVNTINELINLKEPFMCFVDDILQTTKQVFIQAGFIFTFIEGKGSDLSDSYNVRYGNHE